MSDKFLFDRIKEEFGQELRENIELPFVNDNLNSKLELRDYQKQALTRFYKYYETSDVKNYNKPSNNIHLAYQMATGSGKTVVMAGLILYLYEKGYRNFLFFVSRDQIVEKTKDNFINQQSSKYLFNEKILINHKLVNIQVVDNFFYKNDEDINICFATVQRLFQDLHTEKENSLTLEDFKDNKIVFLADEAHHMSASTKNQQLDLLEKKPSWENTIERIFKKHQDNIFLEFSATIELDNHAVKKKYVDKLIYNYDIRNFINDSFSKEIKLFKSDTDKKTRMMQALLTSVYREQVAIKHKLNIKPVVLFKSPKIEESKRNQELFHSLLDELTPHQLECIQKNNSAKILKKIFTFFIDENISLDLLVEKIQIAFSREKCLCTNNDKELEKNQKKLNSLEDKNNPIRAIFTVDKLNEGWDVLNLFDIVRLYEGQATGGGAKGKIAKKTVREAQLIGRGARYCPFKIKKEHDLYTRKFDDDITSELRVLEQLYFHSEDEHRYISEITVALKELGWLESDKPVKFNLSLKEQYKNNTIFNNNFIFANKRIKNKNNYVKNIKDFGIKNRNFRYELESGKGFLVDPFFEVDDSKNKKRFKEYNLISFLGKNIITNALLHFSTFTFNRLKKYFPHLTSMSEFLDEGYLAEFNIDIKGDAQNILHEQKFKIALSFLNAFKKELKNNIVQYKGTKKFYPYLVGEIFKDKTLLVSKDRAKVIQEIAEKFFVFEKFYGTSEEKNLIELISKIFAQISEKSQGLYLIRNERHFALYDFKQGRRFEPDFVMLSKKDKFHYQFFIESKGGHLQDKDRWKENFLLEIKNNHTIETNYYFQANENFSIIGLSFYYQANENTFKNNLLRELAISK